MPQLSSRRAGLLVTIVLGVFFLQLGEARLWDRDEPRNARASQEMLARGDWIVPTFNGELRDHKPVLLYWGQMAAYVAAGQSVWSARLPSALAALLSIGCVALLASRLNGCPRGVNKDGFWAAAALATSLLFVMAGRAATPDSLLIAFSTLGITLLAVASLAPAAPYSSGYVRQARWLPAMAGYLALGLAALAKGPVGILLPLVVIGTWWLVCRQHETRDRNRESCSQRAGGFGWWISEAWQTFHPWRVLQAIWKLKMIPGIALALLAAAPWYIAVGMETNGDFLRGFFLEHNVGRAMHSMEGHRGGWWFYPLAFVVGIFPWSLWLIPLVMWGKKAAGESIVQRQLLSLALVWMAVYVVAFSFASTKLPSYITPCFAGAALWLGSYLRQFESTWSMPSLAWRRTAYALTVVVGLLISGGIVWLSNREQMPAVAMAAAAGFVLAVAGLAAWLVDSLSRPAWVPAACLCGAAAFHSILFAAGSTLVDHYRHDLELLGKVAHERPGRNWLSIGGMEPSWVYHLNSHIVEVTTLDISAWEAVRGFWLEHPDGHVIAVGQPVELLERAVYPLRVERVAEGRRFMRPGDIAVFRLASPGDVHQPPTTQTTTTIMTAEQTSLDVSR
jgi:4-amino-4-deoxy-L-arabinose transferase-like glycosyltransferase